MLDHHKYLIFSHNQQNQLELGCWKHLSNISYKLFQFLGSRRSCEERYCFLHNVNVGNKENSTHRMKRTDKNQTIPSSQPHLCPCILQTFLTKDHTI